MSTNESAKRRGLFKQADIRRALKGAIAGGLDVHRIEIDPNGRIVIVSKGKEGAPQGNELDEWVKHHANEA